MKFAAIILEKRSGRILAMIRKMAMMNHKVSVTVLVCVTLSLLWITLSSLSWADDKAAELEILETDTESMTMNQSMSNLLQQTAVALFAIKQPVKIIHVSMKDPQNPSDQESSTIHAWKQNHPQWKLCLYNDTQMRDLVVEKYPEFLNLYDNLLDSVERVDVWRYLIVHAYGGMYADSDFVPNHPIETWHHSALPDVYMKDFDATDTKDDLLTAPQVLLGFEPTTDATPFHKDVQILQWGFYSRHPHHPLFYETVQHIYDVFVNELLTGHYVGDAVFRTGPIPFTWATLRYLQKKNAALSLLDPETSFHLGSDILIGRYSFFDSNGQLATHMYSGTWKVHPDTSNDWLNSNRVKDDETGEDLYAWQLENRKQFRSRLKHYWNGEMSSF